MNEHDERKPYTYITTLVQDGVATLGVDFYTCELTVGTMTLQDGRPYLSFYAREGQVSISTTGAGPVTAADVDLAREIAETAARYLASCERLHAEQAAVPTLPGLNEVTA